MLVGNPIEAVLYFYAHSLFQGTSSRLEITQNQVKSRRLDLKLFYFLFFGTGSLSRTNCTSGPCEGGRGYECSLADIDTEMSM